MGERRAELGLLPEDLAGRVRGLTSYEFTSSEARERFEQLLERLREEVVQSYLDQVAGRRRPRPAPTEREHIRDALDALNKMIEQRAAGEPLDPASSSSWSSSATCSRASRRTSTSSWSSSPNAWRPPRRCSPR